MNAQVEGSSAKLIDLASITAKLEESISTRDHADQSLWRQIGLIEAKLSDLSLQSAYVVSELERLATLYGMLAIRPATGADAPPVPPLVNVGAAPDSESELHALRSQRDALLNANDALRRELQNALRPSGVRKGPPILSVLRHIIRQSFSRLKL
ncbi:hypothetical protein [Methylobacterium sp. E-066]|uniref:hypothetical protein n=1 Tax=Methylobacterium sp. E-066 TaxID=2836584 RepID=UPI001FBC0203|nr:hypothetical protein [Methylobacterium sp. E-066]MCJ2142951.1 hypothetical protein [Methylobacterium sp. E-066]